MALSPDQIKNRYPLPVYNYRLSVFIDPSMNALSTDINTIDEVLFQVISCTEIDGLQMGVEKTIYRHGFSFLTGFHIIPSMQKEVQLTIQKGVTRDGKYLSDWMALSYPFIKPSPLGRLRKRDLIIDLCDEAGLPLIRWIVSKAMPLSLSAPSFKADTKEVAFEKMELIAHELKVLYNI